MNEWSLNIHEVKQKFVKNVVFGDTRLFTGLFDILYLHNYYVIVSTVDTFALGLFRQMHLSSLYKLTLH